MEVAERNLCDQVVHIDKAPRLSAVSFSRELWVRLGNSASAGRAAWSGSGQRGRGFERGLWIAAIVLMAIPIFALLVIALLGAAALSLAAIVVAWIWGMLVRIGVIRPRNDVTVIRVSPIRSDP